MPKSLAICSLRNFAKAELACGTVPRCSASIPAMDRVCTFAVTRNVSTTRATTAGEATRPAMVLRRRQVSMERQSTAGRAPGSPNFTESLQLRGQRHVHGGRPGAPSFSGIRSLSRLCAKVRSRARTREVIRAFPYDGRGASALSLGSSGEIGGSPPGYTEPRAIFPDDPS